MSAADKKPLLPPSDERSDATENRTGDGETEGVAGDGKKDGAAEIGAEKGTGFALRLKKIASKIFSALCTLVLIFSVVAAIGSIFARNTDKVAYIGKYAIVKILTGSMEPTIEEGKYILVEKTDALVVGDIVTFYSDDPALNGALNTHRIVAIAENGALTTKGDNPATNPTADLYPVSPEKVAGRYVTTLDFMTGVFNIFSKPVGFVALIFLPLALLTAVSFKDVVSAAKAKNGTDDGTSAADGENADGEKNATATPVRRDDARVRAEIERLKKSGELEKLIASLSRPDADPTTIGKSGALVGDAVGGAETDMAKTDTAKTGNAEADKAKTAEESQEKEGAE